MKDQAQVKGFDLNLLEEDTGPAVHRVPVITDEDGEPVSGFIIVGKNSEQYQETAKEIRIENIKRAANRKNQIDAKTDQGAELIAKTVDRTDRATALGVVIGWFGFHENGELRKFDKALVAKMFDKYPTWQQQVLSALENDANFMKA